MLYNYHLTLPFQLVYKNANGKHFLLSGSRDRTIRLWKFNCASPVQTFHGHQMAIMGVAALDGIQFFHDVSCISGSRDTTLKTWDISTGRNTRTVEHSRNVVTHLIYNKTRNLLAQTSEDKQLKIWDPYNLNLIHGFPTKYHILKHCDVSADGNYCITSSGGTNGDGCEITLYDLRQRKLLREYKGHEETVNCAVFLPQQLIQKSLMLSISADGTIKIWDLHLGGCLSSQMAPVNVDLLSCVAFNDGKLVVFSVIPICISLPFTSLALSCNDTVLRTKFIHCYCISVTSLRKNENL
ncbi:unnamed protein product [Enterobius vermicularis]|uniref:Uncharacterized protein n=1 Tax=Enterobius vermicularis TaxID=51028 RepID=A0A3P6I1B5_ENTVE|nr:unnamed protein product [Enterobius vermicularis]